MRWLLTRGASVASHLSARRRVVAALSALSLFVLSAGGGAAYAYWSTHGTGSGSISVGTTQNVTVQAATASATSTLVPGGTGDLVLKIDNPNSVAVKIISVS